MEKEWYKSKTLWLSVSGVIGAIAGYLSGEVTAEAAITAGVIAFVNGMNRFTTQTAIKGTGGTSLPTPPPTSEG